MPHSVPRFLVGLLVLALAACAPSVARPASGPGGATGAGAIDRFLQLAQQKQYLQMGWVFGTDRGPVLERDDPGAVEKRMYTLGTVLDADSYTVGSGAPVPGRIGGAERYTVRLQRGNRSFDVPFTVVRGPAQRWYVEQVDVETLTGGR